MLHFVLIFLLTSYPQKVRVALHYLTTGSAILFNVIDTLVRLETGGSLGQLVSRADRSFLTHICEKEGRNAGKSHFTPRHASNGIALRLLPIAAGTGFASPAVAHFQPIADDTSTEPRTPLY